MTMDHQPDSAADKSDADRHTEEDTLSRLIDRPAPDKATDQAPEPGEDSTDEETWPQSGFGSFP